MSKVVFILGAGASVCAGAPILSNIFDHARRLYDKRLLGEYILDFERLNQSIFEISRSHASLPLDTENLETVLDALEMAEVIGGFPDINAAEARETRAAVKRLLSVVIESSILFPVNLDDDGNKLVGLPPAYKRFLSILQGCSNSTPSIECSLITFNYDTLLDMMLHSGGIQHSYCLDGKVPKRGVVRLCKLHGSLNWRLNDRDEIEHIALAQAELANWAEEQDIAKGVRIHHDQLFRASTSIQGLNLAEPYIVPPTHNKLHYHLQVAKVWHQAAAAISEASLIFVIGYSLPPSDQFFRSFLGLSTISRNRFSRFVVIDPSDSTERRYSEIFAEKARRRFVFHKQKFEDLSTDALIDQYVSELK